MNATKNSALKTVSDNALRQVTGGQMGLDWDGRGHGVVPRRTVERYGEQSSPRTGLILTELEDNGSI